MFNPDIPVFKTGTLNQAKLAELKKQFSQYDGAYVANVCYEERRKVLEEAYEMCKPYLDDEFSSEIKKPGKFMDRLWELALCSILLHNNYVLEKWVTTNKARPDFCILLNGRRIWVEAVCPDLGEVDSVEPPPVLLPGVIYSAVKSIADDVRPRALRVSASLRKKFLKRNSYLDSGTMKPTDPFIVAINTQRINYFSEDSMIEELVLYGMGLHQLNIRTNEWSRQWTPEIKKKTKNGEILIPMAYFLKEEYKSISATIFFRKWFEFESDWKNLMSDSAITYFNDGTPVPLERNEITFGRKRFIELTEAQATLREV